jgi:uncharacterized membrane protein affecting hemolysin expression
MKRIFVTLTLMLSLISMSSFANEEKNTTDVVVSSSVLKSFQDAFKNAVEVTWSVSDNFTKASFVMNDQHVSAFYSTNGELLAVTRNISSLQLPLALQTNLKQRTGDFWISELIEVSNDNGTSYYVTLESADTKLVLKSSDSEWTTFQKQSKS